MWQVSNGRYSITDGTVVLIVPYKAGQNGGVQQVIDHLNQYAPAPGKKICSKCQQRMTNHDKYTFTPDGRIAHRDCKNPQAYVRAKGVK